MVSSNGYAEFWRAIATEDEQFFLNNSKLGVFETCLPEWHRMRGVHNTQHATHDFPLDVHTAKVLTKTRQSPYFQTLPPPWQELTTLAALLHDIDKEGGLLENRFALKPDMAHPAKAVATVRKRLPSWGFSQQAVEWASLLVAHHQAFGRWIMRSEFAKIEPTAAEIHQLADTLRSTVLLQALQALTEGDIRGVKAEDKLFTPFAQDRLATYGARVHQAIVPIELAQSQHLTNLLHALGTTRQTAETSWLFSTNMKPSTPRLQENPLTPQTLVATLPSTVLTDEDASPCGVCELKNQASNKLFSVELQPLASFATENQVRVGLLADQFMNIGQYSPVDVSRSSTTMLSVQVKNPVFLSAFCNEYPLNEGCRRKA
jgi:hypothetical protein